VVAGVWLVSSYYRTVNDVGREQTSSTQSEKVFEDGAVPEKEDLPAKYLVQEGDTLWDISEKVYGSGYTWVDVYEANREVLNSPHKLEIGGQITLPKVEPKVITHTVVRGESMWTIAQKYCGSGFAWPSIAAANNVPNPRVIEVGLELTISCR